jgi:hypothetical protein
VESRPGIECCGDNPLQHFLVNENPTFGWLGFFITKIGECSGVSVDRFWIAF